MSETVPGSPAGTQFGPYRLRRLLGRGGMGEVYEAHDTVKDRTVAPKTISQEYNSDNVFRRRMQREAHTAGRLQEPHIVPIHDFGEIDGQLFIDMRFIEGADLSSLLHRPTTHQNGHRRGQLELHGTRTVRRRRHHLPFRHLRTGLRAL